MKKYVTLGEICKLNMGQSPDSSTYNDNGFGIPFYQGNADFGDIHPVTAHWCTSPTKIAEDGDILISVRAPIGALNIATERCCIGRGLAAITVDSKIASKDYIWHMLKSRVTMLQAMGTGSTFKAINKNVLNDMRFLLPTLEEQGEIALNLSKMDEIIRICTNLMNRLDLLVKSRFVEMFGNIYTNKHNFPIQHLSDYIDFLTSGSRGWAKYCVDDGSEWFITIKNVKDCRISTDNIQPVNAPDNMEAKRTKVEEGDLLISITADLGRTGVVTREIAEHGAYINQHLTCIRLDKTKLIPLYVAYFMESESGTPQFEAKNQTGVKAGLNFDSIKSLKLLVPPLALQEQFAAFVEQTDKSKFIAINIKKIIRRVRLNDQF